MNRIWFLGNFLFSYQLLLLILCFLYLISLLMWIHGDWHLGFCTLSSTRVEQWNSQPRHKERHSSAAMKDDKSHATSVIFGEHIVSSHGQNVSDEWKRISRVSEAARMTVWTQGLVAWKMFRNVFWGFLRTVYLLHWCADVHFVMIPLLSGRLCAFCYCFVLFF